MATVEEAFGQTFTVLEDATAALTQALNEVRPLLVSGPRVATYRQLVINPGAVVQAVGYDASRSGIKLQASSPLIFIGERSGLEQVAAGKPGPGVPLPSSGDAWLELNVQDVIWVYNSDNTSHTVAIVTEAHAIS